MEKQSFIEDLSPEQITAVEDGMFAGGYSRAGFLGPEQSLRGVIEADAKILQKYGITHKQIGDRLDSLMGQGFRQWELASRAGKDYFKTRQEEGALIDNFLRVFAIGWMGYQGCPFFIVTNPRGYGLKESYCGTGSHDFTVKNERQGTQVKFPQLMAHLVQDHHFFEGAPPYRLNPEDAINVLELKSGVDYTPKTETEIFWRISSLTCDIDFEWFACRDIFKSLEQKLTLAKGVELYISGNAAVIVTKKNVELKKPLKIEGVEVLFDGFIHSGMQMLEKHEHRYVVG